MLTCKTCEFWGQLNPEALAKAGQLQAATTAERPCFGMPPSTLLVGNQIMNVLPSTAPERPKCSLYSPRIKQ